MPRHSPRLTTFNYEGRYRYFWTLCAYRRRVTFTSSDVVTPLVSQICESGRAEGIAISAYCFMPDHLHLLLEGAHEHTCAVTFINRFKQSSGFSYARQMGQRLWQKSSWDRVLRSEDDTWAVIRYILANPVRAGLVSEPLDYPFSGSLVYERAELIDAFQTTAG